MPKRRQSPANGPSAAARRVIALAGNPPDIDTAIMMVVERLMKDVPTPPTDLEALALPLKVSGFEAEDMPISGELRRVGNQLRVFYSSYLPLIQRRFTIAHELGHAVLALSGRNYPRAGEEVERICDMLAAEFLMPTVEFRRRLGQAPTAEKILDLATLFKAPLYSVAIRAAEFQDLSVFTLEDGLITWAFGTVRKGPLYKNSLYLKAALDTISASPTGNITFPMSGEVFPSQASLSWMRIANGNRAFCVLRRLRPILQSANYDYLSSDEISLEQA